MEYTLNKLSVTPHSRIALETHSWSGAAPGTVGYVAWESLLGAVTSPIDSEIISFPIFYSAHLRVLAGLLGMELTMIYDNESLEELFYLRHYVVSMTGFAAMIYPIAVTLGHYDDNIKPNMVDNVDVVSIRYMPELRPEPIIVLSNDIVMVIDVKTCKLILEDKIRIRVHKGE